MYGLKSRDVKRQYPVMLLRFLNFIGSHGESIEEQCLSLYTLAKEIENRKIIESKIMQYINHQRERIKKKEISAGTLRNYIKAIRLFCVMNDILINWDKIKKGVPTFNPNSNDRIPEIPEIKTLLEYNDIRIKPIVLTMLSSGIHVGAWDWLKWKNIIPIERNGTIAAAKIVVYYGEPEQYFSFITPEAYHSLKSYMDFRLKHGERIDGESWLIRDQWQKISKAHGHRIGQAGKPKRLDAEGIRRLIYDAWKIQGIITIHNPGSEDKHHPFKSSHGFRKFFETQCELSMKSEDVEILMGHSSSKRGLKANYYRPSESHLLEQYLKVAESLTISEENKLSKKVKELKEKQDDSEYLIKSKLQEKDDAVTILSDQVMKLMEEIQLLKASK